MQPNLSLPIMLRSFMVISTFIALCLAQTAFFDAREATISSVHHALFSRENSCRDIVEAFIARIEAYNHLINAIITLNPNVLNDADRFDTLMATGNGTGSLFCIPILLKDNYDAINMSTTAGCAALKASKPYKDSRTVVALRNAGAIVLGKTNLHEFALEGLSVSTAGGQTINPYDFTRTPGGSSGGTGAAIAASFAVLGTGTDTVNSLRSPASANSLYSFRPTYGLISRAGIVPVSWTQDTAGAIGRSLQDIATVLTVMAHAEYDPADNATSRIPPSVKGTDYTESLAGWATLRGIRIGILWPFFDGTSSSETDPVNEVMSNVLSMLAREGAALIHINDSSSYQTYNVSALLSNLDVQQFEFRELLDQYLSSNLTGPHPTSMPDLYLSNRNTTNFLVIPAQYTSLQNAFRYSTSDEAYFRRLKGIANLTATLQSYFHMNELDAIIYPEQRNLVVPIGSPSQSGRNGILAALTGSPVITIPVGFSNATATAPIGLPIGMEIFGLPWTESKLLTIAKAIDTKLHARQSPITGGMNGTAEVTQIYDSVPFIKPSGMTNIDTIAYPVGRYVV